MEGTRVHLVLPQFFFVEDVVLVHVGDRLFMHCRFVVAVGGQVGQVQQGDQHLVFRVRWLVVQLDRDLSRPERAGKVAEVALRR